MSKRDAKVIIVVATRGHGKTDFSKALMMANSKKRAIVLDTFDRDVWRTMEHHANPDWCKIILPIISKSDLGSGKPGYYRLIHRNMNLLIKSVLETETNTIIDVEDATRFWAEHISEEAMEFVFDSKQAGDDLVLKYHSLAEVPRKLISKCDFLCLGQTNEGWTQTLKSKCINPAIKIAFDSLAKSKNKYEFITIQLN